MQKLSVVGVGGLLVLFSVGGAAAEAADTLHYVRSGASGGDGSSWSQAWSSLPASLQRGHTYYVADGSYPGYVFNDSQSGSSLITIKKATSADHGTNTGWNSSWGDGVATFSALDFATGYYVVDGQTGSGQGQYGFEVYNSAGADSPILLIRIQSAVTDITVRYVNVHRPSLDYRGHGVYAALYYNRNLTFSHCYLHDLHGVHFYFISADNVTIDNCVMARNKSTSDIHSESIQARETTNMTVRYSWFEDIQGTGVIISGSGDSAYWNIHGTVFYATPGFIHGNGHGTIADNMNGSIHHVSVYNNTFAGIAATKAGVRFWNSAGNNVAYNNVYYGCSGVGYIGTGHDYETYYSSVLQNGEYSSAAHDVVASGDPFIGSGSRDFRLRGATAAGLFLSSLYNYDPLGNRRGADGLWDRGAYEYGGAPQPVLERIEVLPASAAVAAGEMQQFTAVGFDQNGDSIAIDPTWSASGGTISGSGLFTAGVIPGNYVITAEDGGISGHAACSVAGGAGGRTYLAFDGGGDYVEVADANDLDLTGGAFTIEAWI
ncbi:MAG: right-handed parallel beta-helix repeat-containing protein, partial [Phycisphaerae bacterium]|nr:right-handed parallel beta-helix repeat-containing protein [Phycisphaerae bacterium]